MAQNPWGISEKQLENWFVKQTNPFEMTRIEVLGRQVPLPHGRLDVLMYDGCVYVVELKARPLKESDVGQVLRYRYDVQEELSRIAFAQQPFAHGHEHTLRNAEEAIAYRTYWRLHGLDDDTFDASPVTLRAVLIGTECDDNLLAAAFGANISVYLWSVDQTGVIILEERYPLHLTNQTNNGPFAMWTKYIHRRAVNRCRVPKPAWVLEIEGHKLVFDN